MFVRFLKSERVAYDGVDLRKYQEGEVFSFPDAVARNLIVGKIAVPVEEPQDDLDEILLAPGPSETAVAPGPSEYKDSETGQTVEEEQAPRKRTYRRRK